ncbi:MAG: hypothetical protein WCL24_00580 [Verrucomicrobiota bacterium]
MKRPLIFCLLLPLLLATGCWHSKKKPKEITAVATDVEEGFKQRWMEKRTGELLAQGLRIDIARQQAIDEFRARYSYTRAADK